MICGDLTASPSPLKLWGDTNLFLALLASAGDSWSSRVVQARFYLERARYSEERDDGRILMGIRPKSRALDTIDDGE